MINQIVKEIESSLRNENFMAALSLALTLPDICGKAEFPNEGTGNRYKKWYDEHVGKYERPPDIYAKDDPERVVNDDMPYMSGEIVYSLRNCFLHQGTPNIEKNKIHEPRCQLSHFSLTIASAMDGGSSSILHDCYTEAGRRTLEINIVNLCCKLCLVAKDYYRDNNEKFDFFQYDLQDKRKEGEDILWGLSISDDEEL
ncbi:MAG: hypothetical protein J6U54_06580 [Clostridiales bacterium]|nr:hypothetical protein [Clostridiales bacterium]